MGLYNNKHILNPCSILISINNICKILQFPAGLFTVILYTYWKIVMSDFLFHI